MPKQWLPRLVTLLTVLLPLCHSPTAPAHAAGTSQTGRDYRISRPGLLAEGPADGGAGASCLVPVPASAPAPVRRIAAGDGYGGDEGPQSFAWHVMTSASAGMRAEGGAGAADGLVAGLRDWARADALTALEATGERASNTNIVLTLRHTLIPLLTSWSLVRDRASSADREAIGNWLGRLVALSDVETGPPSAAARFREEGRDCAEADYASPFPVSNCNNVAYHRDLVAMQWGVLSGDEALYRRGIDRYALALRQMRPDGSLPLETARGARALWYQRLGIGLLVHIAELAALQGHDLYGLRHEGRDIHAAVAFLLDAIGTPALVLPYAMENRDPGPGRDWTRQDLGFLKRRGHGRHYMAWVETYAARFPAHPNTARLLRLLGPADRPLIDETAGGNASCLRPGPIAAG